MGVSEHAGTASLEMQRERETGFCRNLSQTDCGNDTAAQEGYLIHSLGTQSLLDRA